MGNTFRRCLKKKDVPSTTSESLLKNSEEDKKQNSYESGQEISQRESADVFLQTSKGEVPQKLGITHFKMIKTLGRGAFAKVLLVSYQKNYYAMKIIKKTSIVKTNHKKYTLNERTILQSIDNQYIVKLHYAFQNAQKLYLVMDFC